LIIKCKYLFSVTNLKVYRKLLGEKVERKFLETVAAEISGTWYEAFRKMLLDKLVFGGWITEHITDDMVYEYLECYWDKPNSNYEN